MRPAVAGTTLREIVCSLIVKDEFENPRMDRESEEE